MAISKAFVWGNGGAQLTPEEIAKQREVEDALLQRGVDTSPVGSPWEGLARVANAAAGSFRRGRLLKAEGENKAYDDKAFGEIASLLGGGSPAASSGASGAIPLPVAASEVSAVDPGDMTGNQVYNDFMGEVGKTVKNPYGLAAIAATGNAESKFSPGNVNRTWSDPSESGQPGTAGGIMSWRGPRYEALAATGDLSPTGQAKFFVGEDPNLIASLNGAKSLEEAQSAINRAWAFRGYDRPGGEAARRLGLAKGYLPSFQGQGAQVASLDPAAGLPQPDAAAATSAAAPGSGYVDPKVVTQEAALPPLPSRDVGAPPSVAAVQPVQVAQAAPTVVAPNGQAIPPEVLKVLGDPRVSQRTRGIAQLLLQQQQARQQAILEQRLKQSDPGYQADLRLKTIQADQLLNPQMSPAEKARIDMDREKFGYEKTSDADKLGLDRDKFNADKANNALTTDIKEYDAYAKDERDAGRTPLGRLDYQLAVKRAGASSTNVTTGEGSSFYKKLDEKNAETYAGLSDTGMQARAKMAQIDRLEGLMRNAPQGGVGVLKQAAGEWGIATEGLSDIQAASALLEKMVPAQRAPGSGPMSDADIKMFRSSLPRVINQPGGNQLIFQTMRGITQYEIQMGEIADRVANREIEPSEARRQIQELKNPLADFKFSDGPTPNKGTTSTGIPWSYE